MIPTRVFLAPINTGFSNYGIPDERLVEFHRQRSGKAIGMSTLGNVAVKHVAASNNSNCVLDNSSAVPHFAKIAEVIKGNGSLAGIQIAHVTPGLAPVKGWRARDHEIEKRRLAGIVSDLPAAYLSDALAAFVESARLAESAGFDMVQIHAAHGYLLSLLLREEINSRNDDFRFNGPWMERLITDAKRVINSALLSVRLSLGSQLATLAQEADVMSQIALRMTEFGVDIIDFSAGLYSLDRTLIYPKNIATSYFDHGVMASKKLEVPVVVSGRVNELGGITGLDSENLVIGLGRALIADPFVAQKIRDDDHDNIVHCELKGQCHYFTLGEKHIRCGVNSSF